MGVKENIERAIITNDWEEIRGVYKFLFKEEAPTGPELIESTNDNYTEEDIREIIERFTNTLNLIIETFPFLKEQQEKTQLSQPTEQTNTKKNTQFITEEDPNFDSPEYKKAIKAHAKIIKKKRKSRKKEPYKPDTRKCSNCNNEFDYRKEYPVGEMSESPKGLCHNCARRGRASKR